MTDRVVELMEPAWEWDDGPRYLLGVGPYKRQQKIDPTPAYAHDRSVVEETLALCEARFPVTQRPTIFSLRHEVIGRTNGWTSHESDYSNKDEHGRHRQLPFIVLSGKRIPPHPAMTRYLVAHEYGHVVDTFLAHQRYKGTDPSSEQDAEYIKLRGVPNPNYYGPGTWHASPGEVFANDFRILACGVETEYWPHPGIARPENSPAAVEWWRARISDFAKAA